MWSLAFPRWSENNWPEDKVFASLGYVHLVPYVQVVFIEWLVIVAFVNKSPLQTITVGCARTTSWLPSNLIKGKVFLMEFFLTFSGKYQGKLGEFLFHKVLGTLLQSSRNDYGIYIFAYPHIRVYFKWQYIWLEAFMALGSVNGLAVILRIVVAWPQ